MIHENNIETTRLRGYKNFAQFKSTDVTNNINNDSFVFKQEQYDKP